MYAVPTLQSILEQGLVSRIAAGQTTPATTACPTGIASVDDALPGAGLGLGMTHEWILEAGFAPGDEWGWRAPLILMAWLAAQAGGMLVAIGRRCWPSAWTLRRVGLDLENCILADPRDDDQRLWAIDQSLRCPGVSAVLADASGLDMAASRRLQLAAEAGGTLGLLARPPSEAKSLSAAATRWVVSPRVSATKRVSWRVELRRCKAGSLWSGARAGTVREWVLEWDERRLGGRVVCGAGVDVGVLEAARETGGVRVAADVAGGPGQKAGRKTA
jgi:protein ImuA